MTPGGRGFVLLLAALVIASPASAANNERPPTEHSPGVERLWETFPLDEQTEPASPRVERPRAPQLAVKSPAARRAETTPVPRRTFTPPSSRTQVTTPAVPSAPSPAARRAESPPLPRRPAAPPRAATTPAPSRVAAPPPLTPAPGSSDALNLPVVAILAASLLALVGLAALTWRFVWAGPPAPRGFDRSFAEIGAQVLVALVVSAIVGWLIATRFPV
jgi:hypothetical protein